MPYCPICEAEYREGVQRCNDCDKELVAVLPEENAETIDPEAIELAELASFTTTAEADMIRELLESNTIRTVIRGESDPIGAASQAEPTTLLVEQRDLERARGLYEAFFAGQEGLQTAETPATDEE